MARLAKTVVAEREAFALENFRNGMDLDQANAALVQKDGMKMGYYRLRELFESVKGVGVAIGVPVEISVAPPLTPVATPSEPVAYKASIFDKAAPVLSSDSTYQTIPEIIKDINAGKYNQKLTLDQAVQAYPEVFEEK